MDRLLARLLWFPLPQHRLLQTRWRHSRRRTRATRPVLPVRLLEQRPTSPHNHHRLRLFNRSTTPIAFGRARTRRNTLSALCDQDRRRLLQRPLYQPAALHRCHRRGGTAGTGLAILARDPPIDSSGRRRDQDPIVYYGLGMVEMEMGHAEAAIRALHRVIDLAGDTIDSPPYTEVGIALFSRGDTSGSSRAYALSLAKDPNDLPALINLGWNHYSEGRLDSGGRYDGLGPASAKSNSRRPMGITRWRMYAAVPQAPTPSPISGPSIASM